MTCFHLYDHIDDNRNWTANGVGASLTVAAPPNGGPGDFMVATGLHAAVVSASASAGWSATFQLGGASTGGLLATRTRDGTAADALTVTYAASVHASLASYSIQTDPAEAHVTAGGTINVGTLTFTQDPITGLPFDPNRGYLFTIYDANTTVTATVGVDEYLHHTIGTDHARDFTFDGNLASITFTAGAFDATHYIAGWQVASFLRCTCTCEPFEYHTRWAQLHSGLIVPGGGGGPIIGRRGAQ